MAGPGSLFAVAGRVACVTGASSGIGRALASALAGAGARVVGIARRAEALEGWRAEAGGETAALAADLSDPAGMAEIAARAAEPFGPPEILVNAAGINARQPADEVTREGWRTTLDLNLAVPFFLAQRWFPG